MNEGALCKEDRVFFVFFAGGGREGSAAVDGKLDGEIKLPVGGTDQLDNDKQSLLPKART